MVKMNLVTRSTINQMLRNKRLNFPWKGVLSHHSSPTVGRLKKLAAARPNKFSAYMSLLDSLVELGKEQDVGPDLVLFLPSERALLNIDIERLLRSETARQEIVRKCYRPAEGRIDLRPLVSINRMHFPDITIPR